MISLGFVGFGEAAFHLADGLREDGLEKIFVYDIIFNKKSKDQIYETAIARVKKTNSEILESMDELAALSNTVILAVPAQFTEIAAKDIISHLKPGQLLVDVTSASPQVKRQIGQYCAEKEILFTDSPMLGPLTVNRHKVPIIACGSGAHRWLDEMSPFGMNIQVIEGEPGNATQIKLARSIFTKGFEALLVETFLFARKCGVEDIVMESIEKTMDDATFRQSATRYMASDLIHAERKSHEMKDAIDIMRKMGITPMVGEGALSRLKFIADLNCAAKLEGIVPKSLVQIYSAWESFGAI